MCIFKNKHMKLIIKNDSKETVKNPNVKIIETTEASFTNQTVFIEENDVPIIKYTDTESMYFVKDLDNLYDRKSRSEVLLDITIDNLELIGGGSGGDFVPLTGTEVGSPVTGDIQFQDGAFDNKIGHTISWDGYQGGLHFNDGFVSLSASNSISLNESFFELSPIYAQFIGTAASSPGIKGAYDYTANITDLDYTQKKYVDQKVADSRPYKVYTALLTQTGTDAPVATVLENTLGGEVVWSYIEVGNYFGSISNEGFVNDKTIGFVSNNASTGRYVLIDVYGLIPDQIGLQIKNSITNLSIDGISGQPIEIRVYN